MRVDKNKILLLMAKRNMLQKDLAYKADMSRSNLSTIINGKSVQTKTAYKIAKALEVDVTEIIEQ